LDHPEAIDSLVASLTELAEQHGGDYDGYGYEAD
jgi:regulator of RNase E activity RraB